MSSRSPRVYHLFLLLSFLHLLAFYFFWGYSTIYIHNDQDEFFDDQFFNYFFFISLLLVFIWLTYFINRKRIRSSRLVWIHFAIVFAIVLFVPRALLYVQEFGPRRYLDTESSFELDDIFGPMTWTFVITASALLITELFLISNLKPKRQWAMGNRQ